MSAAMRKALEQAILVAKDYCPGPVDLRIVTLRMDEAKAILASLAAQAEQPKAEPTQYMSGHCDRKPAPSVPDEKLRRGFENMLQVAHWTGGHRDIHFDRDECDDYESYAVHIAWNAYLEAVSRYSQPAPSVPEAITAPERIDSAWAKGWNACRAAVLAALASQEKIHD